jgi:hypothetical protein
MIPQADAHCVHVDARHHEILRLDIRFDQFSTGFDRRIAAAAQRYRGPAETDDLQEIPAADATTAHDSPL